MLTINEIREILPHQYPFLLVDKVLHLGDDKKIIAKKNVTINEPFFQGHFPTEPVMPGVLILEALAQTGCIYINSKEDFKGKLIFFAGADKVKFRKKVVPGDSLILEIEILKLKKFAGIGFGKAYVDDELVCEAQITFMIES